MTIFLIILSVLIIAFYVWVFTYSHEGATKSVPPGERDYLIGILSSVHRELVKRRIRGYGPWLTVTRRTFRENPESVSREVAIAALQMTGDDIRTWTGDRYDIAFISDAISEIKGWGA